MQTKRFLPVVLLLCVSAWSAAAENNSLRFRVSGDPVTLDWNLAQGSHETHVLMNLMEGLVDHAPDLTPRPALAERWEISPDGRTYTFLIRPGVKWSDGASLTAGQFRDSWLRLLSPKTRSTAANFLFDIENAEAFHDGKIPETEVGIKVLDERRLQVRLRRVVPHFLHLPTFWVTFPIRNDLIAKYAKDWASPGKMVSIGPYVLSEWKRGNRIVLKKNPHYYGKTSVAEANISIVKDDARARSLFQAGKIDFFLEATTEDLLRVQTAGNRVAQFPYLATYYLGFNVRSGLLKDRNIRRALSVAAERAKIGSVLQGGQIPAKGWVPPGMPGHHPEGFPESSLFEARSALAKAGYPEGRSFPALSLWIRKFDGAEKLGDFLRSSFKEKLGIATEVVVAGPAEFDAGLKAGKASMFVAHWGADFPDPSNFYEVYTSNNGSNRTGWKDSEYDSLIEKAGATLDAATRLSAYTQAEEILLKRETVIVPLFYRRNVALLGPKIRKLEITPLNYLFLKSLELAP